ncbi:MAG: hypothetical protein WCR59_12785, partial [Planctomycetota bacterium]
AIGALDVNVQTARVSLTGGAQDMLGLAGTAPTTVEDLLAHVHASDRQEVSAGMALAMLQRDGYRSEFRVLADGVRRWLRLEIGASPDVYCVNTRGILPGHNSYDNLSPTRLRPRHIGLAFKVSPPQPAFGPEQVRTGVTRPHASPNQWRSDPSQGLPQWLQLEWVTAQQIARVELTFPGQLLAESHIEDGFSVARQLPKDYTIQVDAGDGVWREVERIEGNREWRQIHDLSATVSVRRLRVVITSTNGDPAASINEVRCYR